CEATNPCPGGPSQRVAGPAGGTAGVLGMPQADLVGLRLGGELHDIGKIGTRDAVLHKPRPLTEEESAEIKQHTIDGEAMLSVLRDDHPTVLQIVRWHHERLDGSGFPDGLAADSIPMPVRIIS